MRFFFSAFLGLLLSTFTLALSAGGLEGAQVCGTIREHRKSRRIIDMAQLERRQGNAGPLESTLSGASSSYRSPTYAILSASTSADSSISTMSMTLTSTSVSGAAAATTSGTTIASGTTFGTEQGAGAKAPGASTSGATASGTTIGTAQGAGAKAPTAGASSSKGGAPMATGNWAAAGILAVGVGGLMI